MGLNADIMLQLRLSCLSHDVREQRKADAQLQAGDLGHWGFLT